MAHHESFSLIPTAFFNPLIGVALMIIIAGRTAETIGKVTNTGGGGSSGGGGASHGGGGH